MITRILSLQPVQDNGITRIYPLKVPQGKTWPNVVYQVMRDWPESPADGRCNTHWCRIRITCLAREKPGEPGYQAARDLATAIEGDSNPTQDPSGLSGWLDDEGNCWIKEESFDSVGTVIEGTDQYDAYAIDAIYLTAYTNY